VGQALVAVGVDAPLSRHDIELIRSLSRYTPNISLLLTKVDVLNQNEPVQVRELVQNQLSRYWNREVPVFPYSVQPGFEHLRAELDGTLLCRVRADSGEQHTTILLH
jgi:GTP-binding protein EngB required for normal cell division